MGLCSKEASAEAMVYSYKHGFTGFAAKLTGTQARIISGFLYLYSFSDEVHRHKLLAKHTGNGKILW